jgi:Glutaredoxin-like domain (DUF836).
VTPFRWRLLSRRGCHLCDALHAELVARFGARVAVEVVDIDGDPVLRERWGLVIPVLLDERGDEVCRFRLDAVEAARRLARRPV